MSRRSGPALLLSALCAMALWGCLDPIVGVECREGLHVCNGQCVNLSSDFEHCGECNHNCGPFRCIAGRCSETEHRLDAGTDSGGVDAMVEGGAADTGVDAGDAGDAGRIRPIDASLPDTNLGGCVVGEQECDGVCVRTNTDVNHCGACNNRCAEGMVCSGGQCVEACEESLTRCGSGCVDTSSDPRNCGGCGNQCASGICIDGQCADATSGHAVVVGHDFESSTAAMRRLAGNAVFLARGAPVRVLTFGDRASQASIDGTRRAIDYVADADGRTWDEEREDNDALITLKLAAAEVLVIYAQQNASNNQLEKWGRLWGQALAQFLRSGGVVVVFDGPSDNRGTFSILEPALIFSATENPTIPANSRLTVVDPGDQIAVGAPRRYVGRGGVVGYEEVSTPADVVVEGPNGTPVILHRIVTP